MSGVTRVLKGVCFASFVFYLPIISFAHSGGTDKNGCHAGSEPYHCHNGSDSSEDSSGADIAIMVGAVALVMGVFWYYSQSDGELFRFTQQEVSARGWMPTVEVTGNESEQSTSVGLQYRF